jgi:serine/threonine protein kinase
MVILTQLSLFYFEVTKFFNCDRDVVFGMTYLHEEGYLHRNLNPSSILITMGKRLRAKISDFSVSRKLDGNMILYDNVTSEYKIVFFSLISYMHAVSTTCNLLVFLKNWVLKREEIEKQRSTMFCDWYYKQC